MPFKVKKPILACGADIKGAFAIARNNEAILVDGFGDLGDLDNFTKYEKAVKRALTALDIKPEIVACDMHPGYFSTQFAEDYTLSAKGSTLCKVQHHEAHIASAIVDNAIKGSVIGIAFDGTGYGLDGNIWGGEFFVGSLKKLKRAGHFEYIPMPGGDKVVTEPWRMTASYLYLIKKNHPKFKKYPAIKKMITCGINSPLTSSAGRLFDAVGSLVLCKDIAVKEAELPMELEKIAASSERDIYEFDIKKLSGLSLIDVSKVIKGVLKDLSAKREKGIVSAKFHNTIAKIISETTLEIGKKFKVKKVVLSGGVFQNKYLLSEAVRMLREEGFDVYTHSNVAANDAGIPIGQIAIARHRSVGGQARARCA